MWSGIPPILRNKYVIALIVVFVWLLFFDNYSLIQHWRLQREIYDLRRQQEFYLEEIRRDSMAIDRLQSDPDALERYAREKYLMKREGEDVYIITEEH